MAKSATALNGDAAIPASSLPQCLFLLLLLTVNDVILREPSVAIASMGLADVDLELVRVWLNLAFFGALLVTGAVSIAFWKELSLGRICAMQGATAACSLVLSLVFFLMGSFSDASFGTVFPYALFFFLGLFAAFGLLFWVSYLALFDWRTAWLQVVVCLLLSSFSYMFVLYLAHAFPAWAVFGILCLLSYAANCYVAGASKGRSDEISLFDVKGLNEVLGIAAEKKRLAIRDVFRGNYAAVLCIAALNFVLAASRMALESIAVNMVNSLCAIGICIAAVSLFLMSFTGKKEVDALIVYRVAFPAIALAFLALPFLGVAVRGVFMVVATAFGTMGTTILFLMAFRAKRSFGVPTVGVYGLTSGFVHVFLFLGLLMSLGDVGLESDSAAWYAVFAGVLVYVFLIVFLISRKRVGERKEGVGIVFIGSEREFSHVCDGIAQDFGLSQREREVMGLLMLGKGVEAIATDLGITANTVRTHTKNIYRKLDVHTRSEMLDLISK